MSLRDDMQDPTMYSCPPPPDDARDGECAGGGPDSGSNPHGRLIVGEDFTKSLLALRSHLEASCEALVSDIVRTIDLHPNDPVARQVKAALQQSTSMKVTLPLMQLEAAHGDMEEFMRSCL